MNPVSATPGPKVYVDPWTSYGNPGEDFTINVNITGVIDLYNFTFILAWEPAHLSVANVTEGEFLKTGGSTVFKYAVDETLARVKVNSTLTGTVSGVNGNGTLAEIKFLVKASGKSDIEFPPDAGGFYREIKLFNSAGTRIDPKTVNVEEGHFSNTRLYTDPPIQYAAVDENVTVEVSVFDVIDLFGWQFYMEFNSTVLEILDAEEGPFLKEYFKEKNAITFFQMNKLADGYIIVFCTGTSPGYTFISGATGSGTLAYLKFRVKATGETRLHMNTDVKTQLIDSKVGSIPHTTQDGYFTNTALPPIADFTYAPLRPLIGETMTFDASSSYHPDPINFIANYTWNFGDGSPTVTTNETTVTHSYATAGLYAVSLTATDSTGVQGTKIGDVRIRFTHDIAVKDISHSPIEVTAGETVIINVVIENIGTVVENSVSVTAYYGDTAIETKSLTSLSPDATSTVTFDWVTSGVSPDTYRIKAVAQPVQDETSTVDNEKLGGEVTVKASASFPMELAVAGIAIVAVGGISAFLYIRRKRTSASST